MASVASKPRSDASRQSPTRRARANAKPPKKSAQAAKKKAQTGTRKVAKKAPSGASQVAKKAQSGTGKVAKKALPGGKVVPNKLARAAAKKALKVVARKAVRASAATLRAMAERGAELGRDAAQQGVNNRLPIQVGIDVAAPLDFVWDEWEAAGLLPEGVHRIEEIERRGDRLTGTVAGPRNGEWKAEILDEREYESFAWRSVDGSDCAGLVTFHRLSDRLTRIELDLDVVPTNPAQALSLSLHLAHRHAEADLRRFKAQVEFINPDAYDNNGPDEDHSG